jgi:hypothetical protein
MRKRVTTFLLAGAAVLTAMPALAASPQTSATPTANSPTSATSSATQAPADAAASTPPSQTAAASATVSVGATVKDTTGGTVGTIESLDGQYAVLATTKNKVRLPISSFGKGADGPILAMTQAQVDAAAAAASKTGTP